MMLHYTWVVFLMLCSVSAQTLYFDQDQLDDYARLCQQLRNELYRHTTALANRLTDIDEILQAAKGRLSANRHEMKAYLASEHSRLSDISVSSKSIIGPVLGAVSTDPFTDINAPIFNSLSVDHGAFYDPEAGEAFITKEGVYLLEFKTNGQKYRAVYLKVDILTADGDARYSMTFYTDYEVTGFFRILKVEAGDTLHIKSFKQSGNYYVSQIRPGVANVLAFRYLGQKVDLGLPATTTVAAAAETTDYYWY